MRRTAHTAPSMTAALMIGLALTALITAPACSDKKEQGSAARAGAAPDSLQRPPAEPLTEQQLLALVPTDAQMAVVVRDLPGLFRLFGELQASLGSHELGASLLARARTVAAGSPVPFPWTEADLRRLGIDPARPLLVMGRGDRLLAHVGLKDPAVLRKSLGKMGVWSEETHAGEKLAVLRTDALGRIYCRIGPAAGLCGNDREAVARWDVRPPERSVFATLGADQREAATSASVLVWGNAGRQGGLFATATVESDGLSLQGRINLPQLARESLLAELADVEPSESKVLGLAQDARSLLFLRLPLRPLRGQLPELRAEAGPLADLVSRLGALSGDVVALEGKQGELGVVLGASSLEAAQQIVDELAKGLGKLARAQRRGRGLHLAVTARPLNGRQAYLLALRADAERVPIDLEIGLAAGPLGVVVGSWSAVQRLTTAEAADAAPVVKALGQAAMVGGEAAALGKGTYVGLRMGIEDPFGPFGDRLQQMLPAEAPRRLRKGVNLGRFMLEQMHELTLVQRFEPPSTIETRLRLTTKHRSGIAEDDDARAIWIQALRAKYSGDQAAHDQTLATLSSKYASTRFGQLRTGRTSGLLSMVTGVLAAVAIPAFVRYVRRSKAIEADLNLSRIKRRAEGFYTAQRVDPAGKVQPRGFPQGDSGWTPALPCCKQPGGRCVSTAASWTARPWSDLAFAIDGSHHFQYRLIGKGGTLTVEARADLNCDGRFSSYQLRGHVRGGAPVFDPVRVTDGLE